MFSTVLRSIWQVRTACTKRHASRLSSADTAALTGEPYSDLLKRWKNDFKAQGVQEARLSAEYLLCHAVGIRQRKELLQKSRAGAVLSSSQAALAKEYYQRRMQHEPVQYICGWWEFRDIELAMSPPVLIPRSETEQLVDLCLHVVSKPPDRFFEVGCGSGAVCISLLREWPESTCIAIDISEDALELTRANAAANNVDPSRIRLEHVSVGDVAAALGGIRRRAGLLVSNPPYVPFSDFAGLERQVREYEDPMALCGGPDKDGAGVIREILRVADVMVEPGAPILIECDPSHPAILKMEFEGLGQWDDVVYIRSYKDLQGKNRFCQFEYQPSNRDLIE